MNSNNNNDAKEPSIELSPGIKNNMDKVFSSAKNIIDELEDGEKIIIRDLVDKVVFDTKLSNSIVNSYVDVFVHSYEAVKVEKGRGGGVFKGGRPKRVDNRPRCLSCYQVLRDKKD